MLAQWLTFHLTWEWDTLAHISTRNHVTGTVHINTFIDRAEYGEKTVQKLNLRIDNIMIDLVAEKMQTQTVNDQLDETFELFMGQ